MTTRPVAVRVSQATRLEGSSARQASRMASEIWSAILSGWPSVTDSEVNRIRFLVDKIDVLLSNCFGLWSAHVRSLLRVWDYFSKLYGPNTAIATKSPR